MRSVHLSAISTGLLLVSSPILGQEPAQLRFTWPNDEPACADFGDAIDTTGDIDGDGISDAIVGSALGCVRVLSGATGVELHRFVDETPFSDYGSAVAGAGDVDGDGVPDLLIGANQMAHNGEDSGTAWVHSGADGSVIYELYGDQVDDHFGKSVAALGDIDKDGYEDFAIAAVPPIYPIEPTNYVRVFSGADGSEIFTLLGSQQEGDRFGYSIDSAGDVDGDGWPDILVGVPMDSANPGDLFWSGSVQVFSGKTGKRLYRRYGDQTYAFHGYVVANAGDVDADGTPDFMAGGWGDDTNGENTGMVRVYSGADGSTLYTFHGEPNTKSIGTVVGGVGDLDGDGFDDLAIGMPHAFHGGEQVGLLRLESGADGSRLADWQGQVPGGEFAAAVTSAGDLDGDGLGELLIASAGESEAGAPSGAARLYSWAARALWSPTHLISLSEGGSQTLEIGAGAALAGATYLLLGSTSGNDPGLEIGGLHLPLNAPDAYFDRSRRYPNQPPLSGSMGTLDAEGRATATFTLPGGSKPALAGTTAWHAYLVFDPETREILFASDAVPVTWVP